MIAGSLLLFLEEEDAFWLMCTIVEDLLPASYYSATLIGVWGSCGGDGVSSGGDGVSSGPSVLFVADLQRVYSGPATFF